MMMMRCCDGACVVSVIIREGGEEWEKKQPSEEEVTMLPYPMHHRGSSVQDGILHQHHSRVFHWHSFIHNLQSLILHFTFCEVCIYVIRIIYLIFRFVVCVVGCRSRENPGINSRFSRHHFKGKHHMGLGDHSHHSEGRSEVVLIVDIKCKLTAELSEFCRRWQLIILQTSRCFVCVTEAGQEFKKT